MGVSACPIVVAMTCQNVEPYVDSQIGCFREAVESCRRAGDTPIARF
jgi:hypothetical protein